MKDLLKQFPEIVVDRVVQGRHLKYYLSTPSGPQLLVVSRTPADRKANQNNISLLKRWSRKAC